MNFIDASPYPYPLPDQSKPALVIIDMQRDFVDEGGFGSLLGNDVRLLQAIIPTVAEMLAVARKLGMLVIHTREAHKSDLSDCPESKRNRGDCRLKIGDAGLMGRILIDGEIGNEIVTELQPLDHEYNLAKPGKDAFFNTPLQDILQAQGITHILFAGVTTEVCVQSTMRAANDRGYECLLIEDATESYFPEFKRAAIDMMTAQGGIVGWSAPSHQIIPALEKTYG